MTYFVKKTGSHSHRFFVDLHTGNKYCLCGAEQKPKRIGEKRESKFHNHSSVHNGISYHSKLEANYAVQLDYRKQCGDVINWERQVKLDLKINGIHITNYYIDFVVELKNGSFEFTEIKGLEMDLWKIKWAILEATFEDHRRTPDDKLLVVKEVSTKFR